MVSFQCMAQQENNAQLSKGRLKLKIQEKIAQDYETILLNPCENCPGGRCDLCLVVEGEKSIRLRRGKVNYSTKVSIGEMGVYGVKINSNGERIYELLTQVEISKNKLTKIEIE